MKRVLGYQSLFITCRPRNWINLKRISAFFEGFDWYRDHLQFGQDIMVSIICKTSNTSRFLPKPDRGFQIPQGREETSRSTSRKHRDGGTLKTTDKSARSPNRTQWRTAGITSPHLSSNFATEGVTTNQAFLWWSINRSPRRPALCDQVATLFTDNPETIGLTVTAFVRLSPSPIPWVDIL